MLAFSDIIEFLLRVLGDEGARAEFDKNPQQALHKAGLEGVTAQDIRDARLQLADSGAVSATDDGTRSGHPHGHDPVHEISYTAAHYAPTEHHTPPAGHGDTFLTIDDRDTLFFQSISDDDVNVTDNSVAISGSFNSGSFNRDDSVNNLTAIQANGSFNTVDSNNSDDDLLAIQDNSVDVNVNGPATDPAATGVPATGDPITDPITDAPTTDDPTTHAPTGDAPTADATGPDDGSAPAPVADLPDSEPEPQPEPEPEPEPVDDTPAEDLPADDPADVHA